MSEGRTLGSPSVWKVLASDFYTATSSAVAAFDWSSLTTALEEEGFPDTRRRAEEEDLVFVLEVTVTVFAIGSVKLFYMQSSDCIVSNLFGAFSSCVLFVASWLDIVIFVGCLACSCVQEVYIQGDHSLARSSDPWIWVPH